MTTLTADIGTLTRTRSAAKGWVTRSITYLSDNLKERADRYVIQEALSDLNTRLTSLEEIQSQYELVVKEDDLQEALDEMLPVFNRASRIKAEAMNYVTTLNSSTSDEKHSVASVGSSLATAKLPKLELPHFKDKVTKWPSWWENFQAIVDDTDLPEVTKFSYLQSLLEGEAASVIKGLTLSAKNYHTACSLLAECFGRRELIIFSHIQNLMHLEGEGKSCLSKLRFLHDQVLVHVRSLVWSP